MDQPWKAQAGAVLTLGQDKNQLSAFTSAEVRTQGDDHSPHRASLCARCCSNGLLCLFNPRDGLNHSPLYRRGLSNLPEVIWALNERAGLELRHSGSMAHSSTTWLSCLTRYRPK